MYPKRLELRGQWNMTGGAVRDDLNRDHGKSDRIDSQEGFGWIVVLSMSTEPDAVREYSYTLLQRSRHKETHLDTIQIKRACVL